MIPSSCSLLSFVVTALYVISLFQSLVWFLSPACPLPGDLYTGLALTKGDSVEGVSAVRGALERAAFFEQASEGGSSVCSATAHCG